MEKGEDGGAPIFSFLLLLYQITIKGVFCFLKEFYKTKQL
jgi:hypothetical protein